MIASHLIKIALSDLRSARILYENRQYRTSYFWFQQATEKANKSFGLVQGIITESDLFDIQHKQTKIHRKALATQDAKIDELLTAVQQIPEIANHRLLKQINVDDYRKYLKGGLSYIDSLYNLDLVNIPASELTFLIRELRKLTVAAAKIKKDGIKISEKENREFKSYMFDVADLIGMSGADEAMNGTVELKKFVNNEEQWQRFRDVLLKEVLPLQVDQMFISTTFWFCAIVTVQHSSLTRYPDREGNNPMDVYKKTLPIVNKQPQFMEYLEKALIRLEYFVNLMRSAPTSSEGQ